MRSTFEFASPYKEPGLDKWDTSQVITMQATFYSASAYNQPGLDKWDTSKVTTMQNTFNGAAAFSHDLKSWAVCQVTDYSDFGTGSALTTSQRPLFSSGNTCSSCAAMPGASGCAASTTVSDTTCDPLTCLAGYAPTKNSTWCYDGAWHYDSCVGPVSSSSICAYPVCSCF